MNARSSGVCDHALAGQAVAEVADLAPAHRIRLAGEREGAAAGPADFSGGEVEVADGVRVPGAVRALAEAHGPEAHHLPRFAHPSGARCGCPPPAGRSPGRRAPACILSGTRPSPPSPPYRRAMNSASMWPVLDEEMEQTIQQGEVGAGPDHEVQIGLRRRRRRARIDHDELRSVAFSLA